jgi:transcriptional regulator with GAF, ATPase, and Fis domain
MLTFSVMLYISFQRDYHDLIKALIVLGLLACLYINKERGLERQRGRLVEEVVETRHQVDFLKQRIRTNRVEVMVLEHRLQELNDLNRAISAVNAVTDHRETFDAVLHAALDLVGGDRGSLMLVDPQENTLTFASAVGLEDRILEGPRPRVGDGVAGWVAKRGEPVLLMGDLDEDSPFEMMGNQGGEMNVAMSVPLRLGKQIIGVLNVGSSAQAEKQLFSADEQRFAYLFAQHAAIAVDRADTLYGTRRSNAGDGTAGHDSSVTSARVRARLIEN